MRTMRVLEPQFIVNAFKQTKRTSEKTIKSITERFETLLSRYEYDVEMTDGTKYVYMYQQKDVHILSPHYYHRIIKIK